MTDEERTEVINSLTNKELMEKMADLRNNKKLWVSGIIEAVKSAMCDTCCKYPDQYGSSQNDEAWDAMNEEVCSKCPLNAL